MNSSQYLPRSEFLFIDAVKALAFQVIVFHHLSIYGPISRDALEVWPSLIQFLFDYGRYAVQVFLVLGGFLAMMSLPNLLKKNHFLKVIGNRYLRLAPAFIAAILFTALCALITRKYLTDEFVGTSETLPQFLAHIFLLHGILGVESISAGAWYVAIDWQLYILIAGLLVICRKKKLFVTVLAGLMFASYFYFSQDDLYENWFIYFLSSYGLGVFAYLIVDKRDLNLVSFAKKIGVCILFVFLAGSGYQVSIKIYVALFSVIALIIFGQRNYFKTKPEYSSLIFILRWLSQRSYSIFLIHYSLILIANLLYQELQLDSKSLSLVFMLITWAFSIFTGHLLYLLIERPTRKFQFH